MSRQVLSALVYLERHSIVHADVAAKNVIVDSRLACKLINFHGAIDLQGQVSVTLTTPLGDHYRTAFKWAAPEVLTTKTFSAKSDVWSWGVLLWEIFSKGAEPWPDKGVKQLLEAHRQNKRLENTAAIPRELFDRMVDAWAIHADARPTFKDLDTYFTSVFEDAATRIPHGDSEVHYHGVDAAADGLGTAGGLGAAQPTSTYVYSPQIHGVGGGGDAVAAAAPASAAGKLKIRGPVYNQVTM